MIIKKAPSVMSRPVFISHSVADRDIADGVMDLLHLMGIPHDYVFCTSLPGQGVEAGHDFINYIRNEIQNPRFVILLLSKNYMCSEFCLAELGATWALSHQVFPLVIPKLTFSDLKATLAVTHALDILNADTWTQIFDFVKKDFKDIKYPKSVIWERKRDELLISLKSAVNNSIPPDKISNKDYLDLKLRLNEAKEEITELDNELQRVKNINDKLSKLKDAQSVAEIKFNSLSEQSQFENLIEKSLSDLYALPRIVQETLYYHFRDEPYPHPGHNAEDVLQQIQSAIENQFLTEDLRVNSSDPKISRAIKSLERLEIFIDKASGEFSDAYSEKYNHNLSFTSRQLWDKHLL